MDKTANNLNDLENKNLPKLSKTEEESPKFDEKNEEEKETSRTAWIIIFAFAILATIAVLVWFIFSGREDQKIHGDNLAILTGEETEEKSPEVAIKITDREVDLSDYDSDILFAESGDYTLSGILNGAILVDAKEEVNLILSGVTISPDSSSAILNKTSAPLTISLVDGKINSLTSISSKGDLKIKNANSANGRLISSGVSSEKKITIDGGLIYFNGDKVETAAKADGGLEINGGTVIILSKEPLTVPLSSSTQNSLTVNLTEEIKEGSDFTIRAVSTGSARKLDRVEVDFRNLIYSASDLASGDYEILVDGLVVGTGTVK
ncbi:carbohydrate-binding domain-containing protein [Candidatus Saccharibacteria bacterium]|nr:carbohydrate-binding domain-containing protein [Candidatus Saccharibacteria bacterium]